VTAVIKSDFFSSNSQGTVTLKIVVDNPCVFPWCWIAGQDGGRHADESLHLDKHVVIHLFMVQLFSATMF
jgi:hypothetical protein